MSRLTAPPVDLPASPTTDTPAVRHVRAGSAAVAGTMLLLVLLTGLGATGELGRAGWVMACACWAGVLGVVRHAMVRTDRSTMGPADLVTSSRAVLVCVGAGLTVGLVSGRPVVAALLAVVVPGLLLDAVDGPVARRTGTVSAFGARFDGEVDAFMTLVLSTAVAARTGWWWVLSAGVARYAFGAAAWILPWMGAPLEYRYWRKVVTAAVGILLTVAVSRLVRPAPTLAAVLVALALLGESFGRDVWSLWRRRPPAVPIPRLAPRRVAGRWSSRAMATIASAGAVGLAEFALLAPTRPELLSPSAFLRVPVEAVVVAGVLVLLPRRPVRPVSVALAVVLTALVVLKVLDLAMFSVLDRPFDVLSDRGQAVAGLAFVRDSFGWWAAAGAVLAAGVALAAVLSCLSWAARRLGEAGTRHPTGSRRVVAALAAFWVVGALCGVRVAPSSSLVAAADVVPFVVGTARSTAAAHAGRQRFARAVEDDRFADPATRDLAALRGKDVLVVFVESYGRVAVEGAGSMAAQEQLDAASARLRSLGWSSRSAFLTSPTFGSNSWLAHSTLQSGTWVSDQERYDALLGSARTTLSSAFAGAGWRTVALQPSTHGTWPEGRRFYGFREVYGRDSLGYAGPGFGFSAVPDQFALDAFGRRELGARRHTPVMAVVELTSSHGPWAPLPTMVSQAALGDGSVYGPVETRASTAAQLWSDRRAVPGAYRASIAYSLASVLSFVEHHAADDLVLVVLGDHQPSTIVSGFGGNRDVPVSVLARDPTVVDRIAGWGWQDGLRPGPKAPVWRMDAFRDRFLTTFSHGAARPSPRAR